MRSKRKALFVCPTYAIEKSLRQNGILPSTLNDYVQSGFDKDRSALKDIFTGFSCRTLEGKVLAKDIVHELDWLFSSETEVAVFIFCGHVVNGTMFVSCAQNVSAYTALESLYKNQYQGTFINILNMCAGAGIDVSECESMPVGQAREDIERLKNKQYSPPLYHGITICATGPYGKPSCDKYGSRFVEALGAMFSSNKDIQYCFFEENLKAFWSGASVTMTPPFFTGIFGQAVAPDVSELQHEEEFM